MDCVHVAPDVVVAINGTYLHMHRLEDSSGATDGELQLFNQSLHLFNLHFHLVGVGVIVGIGVLLHCFNFRHQLYYLLRIRRHLGLVVFQLEQSQIFVRHFLAFHICHAHLSQYLSHLQLQFVHNFHNFLFNLHQVCDWEGSTGQEGVTSAPVLTSTSCLITALAP